MTNIVLFSSLAFVCLCLVAWFLIIRCTKGGSAYATIVKTMASVVFVSAGMIAMQLNSSIFPNICICVGLLFAMVGDIVLDLKIAYKQDNDIYLNSGISSFSVSNVFYIAAIVLLWHNLENFIYYSIGSAVVALLFAGVVFILAKPLKLDFTGFKVPVFIYSFLVAMTAVFSLGISFVAPRFLLFALGGILILVSDLVLSMMYFGGKQESKILCVINHVLYYIGELMIVAYLFFQMF